MHKIIKSQRINLQPISINKSSALLPKTNIVNEENVEDDSSEDYMLTQSAW